MSQIDPTTAALGPDEDFVGGPSLSHAAKEFRAAAGVKAADLKERALESAHHFRETAAEKAAALKATAAEKTQHLRESATEHWEETRVRAKEIHRDAEEYVRQNPTKCILCAIGAGFLIGLIVRR
jgi:ElaB/YqjD/DUF883 family membrane-anchored ribosome-binding protein